MAMISMINEVSTTIIAAITCQVLLSPIIEPSTIKVLSLYLLSNCIIFSYLSPPDTEILQVITHLCSLNTIFLLTAVTLTCIRRLYFSPLSHIPGPRKLALSKIFLANEFRHGRTSVTLRGLHQKYKSDVIRVGPNEVSIIRADAVAKIFAGKFPRSTFFEIGAIDEGYNLNSTRDYEIHAPWRRIWEKAFVSSAFKEYNPRVEFHVDKMIQILLKSNGKEVNVTKTIDNLVFDIMADLSFSKHAGLQDGTGDNSYMSYIHKYMSVLGVIGSLRNLAQLLVYLPATREIQTFRQKGAAMLSERQKNGSTYRDIFSYLLSADPEGGKKFTQLELNSNANLAIVAGTDTTSSTLVQTLKALANNPRILSTLQKEIDELFTRKPLHEDEDIRIESIRNLEYLNAVVSEALRLYNPVPSGTFAATHPQGLEVDGLLVPGNVQVSVPYLALMTDERYFPRGQEFIPERWTDEKPELVRDRRAYIPFGYGAHSCVGKTLAFQELRLAIARIVHTFDLKFGPSYDETKYESEWKDYLAVKLGSLWLRFLPREKN